MVALPPRSEVLLDTQMLLSFDVDCGEVLPGHRFIARGLSGPVMLPIPVPRPLDADDDNEDEDEDEPGDEPYEEGLLDEYRSADQIRLDVAVGAGYPGFSLEYELVPGLPSEPDPWAFFDTVVGIFFNADVPLPWEPSDGGVIAPYEGGASTHGSRGDWPLPPDARVLTFAIIAPPRAHTGDEEPALLGRLIVDLAAADARWEAEA